MENESKRSWNWTYLFITIGLYAFVIFMMISAYSLRLAWEKAKNEVIAHDTPPASKE